MDLPRFELVGRTLDSVQTFQLDAATAGTAFKAAVAAAQAQGLAFTAEPVRLKASADLNELVRRSLAVAPAEED